MKSGGRTALFFLLVLCCYPTAQSKAAELKDTTSAGQSRFRAILDAAFRDSTTLIFRPQVNWVDSFTPQASLLVLPGDDWGIKGVITAPGLPPAATTIYSNDFIEYDPLLGQIPLLWLNCRADSFTTTPFLTLKFWPKFYSGEGIQSRFDYYRGDYGFLTFALYAAGRMAGGQKWRFMGENYAYDGYWGLLGSNRSLLRESISQSYRVDFSALAGPRKNWRVALGAAYQKYLPGLQKIYSTGELLGWTHNGKSNTYRAQIYGQAHREYDNGTSHLGGKVSSWIYGRFPRDGAYALKGIAQQGEFFGRRQWAGNRWHKTVSLDYYYQQLQLRDQTALGDHLVTASFQLSQAADSQRLVKVGFQNKQLHYEWGWNWSLTPRWRLNINTTHTYSLYPLMYRLSMSRWQPINATGAGYDLHTVGMDYRGRRVVTSSGVQLLRGKLYIPYRTSYADTSISFRKYQPDYPIVFFNFQYTSPWQTVLGFKTTGAPSSEMGAWLIWGGIQQRINLFGGNLKLLLGGEFIYWGGAEHWGWFDELRSIGRLAESYFTNNRLNFNCRIDGYIGDLHLFYLVNNFEGRAFSTLNGIPYRNVLRIFGVEWSFLN